MESDEALHPGGLPPIEPENYAESVVERIALYREHAGAKPIRAHINVGGGTSCREEMAPAWVL